VDDDLLGGFGEIAGSLLLLLGEALQVGGISPLSFFLFGSGCFLGLHGLDFLSDGLRVHRQVGRILVQGGQVLAQNSILLQGRLVGIGFLGLPGQLLGRGLANGCLSLTSRCWVLVESEGADECAFVHRSEKSGHCCRREE